MKKFLIEICMWCLFISLLIGCSSAKVSINNPVNNDKNILKDGFTLRDTFINNKPILHIKYDELVKLLGKPKDIKYYKVNPPGCGDNEYEYFAAVIYDGIEIEFDLGFESNKREIQECEVFRFDITGANYNFGEIKIGMSSKELAEKCGDIEIKEIAKEQIGTSIYKLMHDLKPDNYYNEYKWCIYLSGEVTQDEEKFYQEGMTTSLGAVILLKNDKVYRIVIGYPNAG